MVSKCTYGSYMHSVVQILPTFVVWKTQNLSKRVNVNHIRDNQHGRRQEFFKGRGKPSKFFQISKGPPLVIFCGLM